MLLPIGDNIEKSRIPVVTVSLIFVNVLIFVFTAQMEAESIAEYEYGPTDVNEVMMDFYSNWGLVPQRLADGDLIGLIGHMFLHGGLAHLIGNMLALWVFGPSLENALGSLFFAAFYCCCGFAGGLGQCFVDFNSEIPLIGASGAIAGLIGAYTLIFGYSSNIKMFMLVFIYPLRFEMPAIFFGAMWILSQLYNASVVDPTVLGGGGVAWFAHIGGFAGGLLVALVFRNQTECVLLQSDSGQLYFKPKDEIGKPKPTNDPSESSTFIGEDEAAQSLVEQGVACQACGSLVDPTSVVNARLAKCSNPACGSLVYLEVEEIMTPTLSR